PADVVGAGMAANRPAPAMVDDLDAQAFTVHRQGEARRAVGVTERVRDELAHDQLGLLRGVGGSPAAAWPGGETTRAPRRGCRPRQFDARPTLSFHGCSVVPGVLKPG